MVNSRYIDQKILGAIFFVTLPLVRVFRAQIFCASKHKHKQQKMFEAQLAQAALLKKILEAIKDIVTDANFECSPTGIKLQAMDTSHVSLVHLLLKSDGFSKYRCDRNVTLGINLVNMAKILKCATNEDSITLKSEDQGDALQIALESEKKDKYSEFQLKLSNIETDNLGIPESEYSATISMSSSEFAKICKDLSQIGDAVTISASKGGVKFSANGEIGNGSVTVRQNQSADKDDAVVIELSESVSLTFALKFLISFTKSTSLSSRVTLSMSKDAPLMVMYQFSDDGHIQFYLAPKIDDENTEQQATKEEDAEDDE